MSDQWDVGKGNYSRVVMTTFEGQMCVVKAVRRYRDREDAGRDSDQEEHADVATEVSILRSRTLRTLLDWCCLPMLNGVVRPGDLEIVHEERMVSSLGFRPAALIYMEHLHERLDHKILALAQSDTGAVRMMRLLCDLLSVVVALHRLDLRHNDLMLRNVMVRRCAQPSTIVRMRTLELRVPAVRRVEWPMDPEYEVVVIDFGLSSGGSRCELPDIVSNAWRDQQYSGKSTVVESNMHPLELQSHVSGLPRDQIDLQCLAHSFRWLSQRRIDPLLKHWCVRYVNDVFGAGSKYGELEATVARVIP